MAGPFTERVLVAVSGGPDSTALLVALHESGCDITAAHFDHALRDGSAVAAAQVAGLCERLGVSLVTERRTDPMPKGSLQAGARALRYAFLERARFHAGADVVALAHTADDLVEGTVMHLLRGCGLAGLRGMPARRGHYVRPFLGVWRSEVLEFLSRRGLAAYEDPANLDTAFARVKVRLDILPALERDRPGILRRLYRVAVNSSRWNDAARQQALEALASPHLTPDQLEKLPNAVAAEALKVIFAQAGGPVPGLSRSHIESMLRLARPGRGGRGVDLPGGLRFRIVGDHMQVIASSARTQDAKLHVTRCTGCDDSQAAHLRLGSSLHVGYRRPGLRLRPLGGRGTRKLQDIFVDARVPREERDGWPLVFAGDRLAWVPGLAVDADLVSNPGEPALHVQVVPMPVHLASKVVRLETPKSPRGEPS